VDTNLSKVYVADGASNDILVLDGLDGHRLDTILLDGGVLGIHRVVGVAVDPHRNRLFAIAEAGPPRAWYLFAIEGKRQRAIRLPGEAGGPVVNPTINKVYIWADFPPAATPAR